MDPGKIVKTIFTSPLLFVNFLKKSSIDNFVGGLVFGSLFSLMVNVLTVQIQENVARQKYLESLENELVNNQFLADDQEKIVEKNRSEDKNTDPFVYSRRFYTSAWDSGVAQGYIYGLDPKIQAKIINYYTVDLLEANKLMDSAENAVQELDKEYITCSFKYSKESCADELTVRNRGSNHYESYILKATDTVHKRGRDILAVFHPTQDRLDSRFMKFALGGQAMEDLKIKPSPTTTK